jgi:hypothetical protein
MRATWAALAIMTSSAFAHADTKSNQAESLFRDGRKAAIDGDFDIACAKFLASQTLEPAPGTLLNLADCEEARGDLAHAWRDFITVAGELASTDARQVVALERARRLERAMPKLRVRLALSSIGAHVWRDDAELGADAVGLAMPVAEGHHTIVVRETGRRDHAYDVVVGHDGERDVVVEHGPRVGETTAGLVFGGLGIAAFGVGATTGGFALARLSSSNADCAGVVCQSRAGVDHYRQAQGFALATDIVLAAGVVLVVTSVVLLLWPHAPTKTILGAGIAF